MRLPNQSMSALGGELATLGCIPRDGATIYASVNTRSLLSSAPAAGWCQTGCELLCHPAVPPDICRDLCEIFCTIVFVGPVVPTLPKPKFHLVPL
jgi:hypothetical protein